MGDRSGRHGRLGWETGVGDMRDQDGRHGGRGWETWEYGRPASKMLETRMGDRSGRHGNKDGRNGKPGWEKWETHLTHILHTY